MAGLRSIVLLASCAVSLLLVGWAVSFAGRDVLAGFARENLLEFATRRHVLDSCVATFAVVVAAGVIYRWGAGPRVHGALSRAARLAAPLLLAPLVPVLLITPLWDPLSTALAIAAFTLLNEQLLRGSLRALREEAGSARPVTTP